MRDRKLGNPASLRAQTIMSAYLSCIRHLPTGTETPLRHRVEVLDEALVR